MKISEPSNQKMLQSIDAANGIEGILQLGKLKIDTLDTYDSNKSRICRLTAVLHLNILNQECYAFCRRAFEKNPDITLEFSSADGSGLCQAYLVKEFPERYNDIKSLNDGLKSFPKSVFINTLDRELEEIKAATLAEEKSIIPFKSSKLGEINFLKRISAKLSSVSGLSF